MFLDGEAAGDIHLAIHIRTEKTLRFLTSHTHFLMFQQSSSHLARPGSTFL
jgi:hypothetical protein